MFDWIARVEPPLLIRGTLVSAQRSEILDVAIVPKDGMHFPYSQDGVDVINFCISDNFSPGIG